MTGYRRMGRTHRKLLKAYRRQDPTLRAVPATAENQPPMRVARGQWLHARRVRRQQGQIRSYADLAVKMGKIIDEQVLS